MEDDSKNNNNIYLRLSSIAIQMAVAIGGFTWFGTYLDEKQKLKTPIWTISLSLFGVMVSMYLVYKEIKNINSNEKK
ncbi:MAG: AtpZ/AtpI family protein [Flavobacteriia bacterium]|jgi:ATP synthase protein I